MLRKELLKGKFFNFGTLQILVHGCHKSSPEETPESAVFLKIMDQKPSEAAVQIFEGWMFASTPALSALDHPVYDIWVKECLEQPGEASSWQGETHE